ncbi:MAG: hypothetical protein R2939_20395 [Kofleriaceae bacterium]
MTQGAAVLGLAGAACSKDPAAPGGGGGARPPNVNTIPSPPPIDARPTAPVDAAPADAAPADAAPAPAPDARRPTTRSPQRPPNVNMVPSVPDVAPSTD